MAKTKTKRIPACWTCSSCMSCFYSDICGDYNCTNDGIPYVPTEMKSVSMALCEGRHEIPDAEDGAIFPTEINPLDVRELEQIALQKLRRIYKLDLYVTGLTVALVSVINVCHEREIDVTLWHYDRNSGTYYPQKVM